MYKGREPLDEGKMKTIHALIYAMGIYGLTLLVTLFVWVVIVGIRRISGERTGSKPPTMKQQR